MFFYLIFVYILFCYFNYFYKKITLLLVLEGMMIFMVFFYCLSFSSVIFSFFILILFSCMMVIDSVFGTSILISCSRWSGMVSSYFFLI